jgi:hypothetical protein
MNIHAVPTAVPVDYEAIVIGLEEDIATLQQRVHSLEEIVARLSGVGRE